MRNLNQNQMADAVASGKHRYDLDKCIGWQIIMGFLCIAAGLTNTIPIGLGLLVLSYYLRSKV
jgi:hypothetical protein